MLAVRIRTTPHARVVVGVQVVAKTAVVTGKGRHRKRIIHAVVLYHAQLQGAANGRGQFNGTVRITYRPAKPVPAHLTVTVRMARRMVSRTVGVTILPGHNARRHRGG